jgi:hypothetical protein
LPDIKGLLDQCNAFIDQEGMGEALKQKFKPWGGLLRKEHADAESCKNFIPKAKASLFIPAGWRKNR